METIFFIVLMVMGISLFCFSNIAIKMDIKRRFSVRKAFDPEEVLSEYGNDIEKIKDIFVDIEKSFCIPKGKIRLDDNLRKDLNHNKKWVIYNPVGDFLEELMKYDADNSKNILTMRDLMNYILMLRHRGIDIETIRKALL